MKKKNIFHSILAGAALTLAATSCSIEPEFYISPDVKEQIVDYLLDVCSTRKNWIVPGLEKGVNMKLFERMRKKGIKGQLWELMKSWSR